jgi:hypothetical protein
LEAEIGGSWFKDTPGKNVVTPHFNGEKLSIVVYTCHPTSGRKPNIGRSWSRLNWGESETLSPK